MYGVSFGSWLLLIAAERHCGPENYFCISLPPFKFIASHHENPIPVIESTEKFWDGMYTRNIGKLIGICYRYTGNRQLAEDLAHDAFVKAIGKAGSFKGDGAFEAWLRSIVVNHTLTYLREQKRRQQMEGWLRDENNIVHVDEESEVANQSEATEFSTHEILEAINSLPEHHRLVFNLYVIDDFKHAQIAEALGISEGTSKSHLARARKKIRQLLAEKVARRDGRRKAFLFMLLFTGWGQDRLFAQQIKNFELGHRSGLTNVIHGSTRFSRVAVSMNKAVIASFVGVLTVVSVFFFLNQWVDRMIPLEHDLTQSIVNDSVDTRINPDNENNVFVPDEKNNSKKTGYGAATIQRNGVMKAETINNKRMKNLNLLGVALVTYAGLSFDSVAQSKVSVSTSSPVETVEARSVVQVSTTTEVTKNGKQEGTFYATKLHWSGGDYELYFKGNVMVDVGDNHFMSTGSVTFLGKVYLLMIDDKPATLDDMIKLSEQQYRLTQLGSEEATRKYGEKGKSGVVEINAIDK